MLELPWSGTWLNLTNVTLTSDPWRGIDTSIANTQQRYYRARQLNFAPDSFAGKTVVATVTNAGPFVVTLGFRRPHRHGNKRRPVTHRLALIPTAAPAP